MRTNKALVYDFDSFYRVKKENEENMERIHLLKTEALPYLTVEEYDELVEFLKNTDNVDEKEKEFLEIIESRELLKTRFDFRIKRRKNIAVYSHIS